MRCFAFEFDVVAQVNPLQASTVRGALMIPSNSHH
jgi:hypothetical protein